MEINERQWAGEQAQQTAIAVLMVAQADLATPTKNGHQNNRSITGASVVQSPTVSNRLYQLPSEKQSFITNFNFNFNCST